MSKREKTYMDPQTGEEIKSTWLARLVAGLVLGLVFWLAFGLVCGLVGWLAGRLAEGVGFGLVEGLSVGLIFGLLGWLVGLAAALGEVRNTTLTQRVHDSIARRQHLRRQRLLRRQEFPHVPDGALSLAHPPGEPEPTAVSLSLAKPPPEEDTPRLAAGVEATETEEQVSTH
jgi:predicted lipid-binding transport protein (Tim44 family)